MITYTDNHYGCDIDGNRGIKQVFYDLDNTQEEREGIAGQLYTDFSNGFYTGSRSVFIINNYTEEDVEFEVDIEEYYNELVQLAKEDKDLPLEVLEDIILNCSNIKGE